MWIINYRGEAINRDLVTHLEYYDGWTHATTVDGGYHEIVGHDVVAEIITSNEKIWRYQHGGN